jgi:hypothetical protein
MNVKQSFKDAATPLTEVIYPTMDGNIYFLDLETGNPTRDPINTGIIQKGTSCLDPRGYPLLYVGQGFLPRTTRETQPLIYASIR